MNDDEFELISAVAPYVNWWHRIKERGQGEFFINGFINHYPDFMVMTKSGIMMMVEYKGKQLWNDENKAKLRLGRRWAAKAGGNYRYFMVFKQADVHEEGAYPLDGFVSLIKDM
jgi:type III restriction enzyme